MRRLGIALALFAATCPLPAYYHFVHYLKGGNAVEKFDLTALNTNTVVVLVSEAGPSQYGQTDSFNSVVNQIRHAAQVWDSVATSALRVRFGGLENTATPRNVPGIDCVFEDLPPGLLGYGGPTATLSPATAADGSQFIPIARSAMHLNINLTVAPGPSFAEAFFTTAVHEMGHALGLQHTFTSATMSTATTRATNLTHPLGADDIAGISLLYPNSQTAQFGSISGQVTSAGAGVHLESVVAIRPGGGAVSAVTNPDGTYTITGVPPGNYYLYAHTMPPDANIYGPWDANGNVVAASGATNTLFYPGTTDLGSAQTITVNAGQVTTGINLALSPRGTVEVYDAGVYSFFNGGAVAAKPADLNLNSGSAQVSVASIGIGNNGSAPGFGVQFMGGNVLLQPRGIQPYLASSYTYIALNLGFSASATQGPQHVVFTTPDYMYVLPSGINLTASDPPTVASASADADGSITLTGTNWNAGSLIYFDSLPATVNSLDPKSGTANVTAPPAASSQTATITVYNPDGQNSSLVQASAPVTYSFAASSAPAITQVSPSSLPAGAEAMIDITATGITFLDGATTAGFGTPDILVRRVFVISPSHIVLDVSVLPGAAQTVSDVSVMSGFEMAVAPGGFQVTAPVAGLPAPIPILINGVTGLTGSYAGAIVSLYGQNLAAPNSTPVVKIGGESALILYASPSQINFQIPSDLPSGPALLAVSNGFTNSYAVVVNIDTAPAYFEAIQGSAGAYVYAGHPAHQGDTLIASLGNFAPAGATVTPDQVQVSVGGVIRQATKVIAPIATDYQVSFPLSPTDATGSAVQIIVYRGGRSSYPAQIPIVAASSN